MATPSEYSAIVEQIYADMQAKGYNGTMADLALALSTLNDDNPATTKWIDLGASSAYAIYVEHGGTMTEAEWVEYLSTVSEKSEQAHADAQSAKESAEAAEQAKTDVTEEAEQAITDIQTEGQTQITAVTNKGTEQVGAVNTAGTTQVNAVNVAGTTQVTAVNTAGSTQVTAVQTQGTTSKDAVTAEGEKQVERVSNQGILEVQAVSGEGTKQTGLVTTEGNTQVDRVTAEGTTQVGLVSAEGTRQVTAVETRGQEIVDSLPEDYTEIQTEVSDLKSDFNDLVGDGRLYEDGVATQSDYYKKFSVLKQGVAYRLKITAKVSGSYDVQFGTNTSSSAMIDTVATSKSFTANTPTYLTYVPTADVSYARLWACDDWDISVYLKETAWNAIEEVEEVSSESAEVIQGGFNKTRNKNLLDESAILKDQRYNSLGNIVSEPGWDTSNAIPVKQGDTLYASREENGRRISMVFWYVILLSENGTMLDYKTNGDKSYTAIADGYVHFTWRYNANKTKFFCGTISEPSYYDTFGYTYISKETEKYKPYKDIVWACVGDSLTEYNESAKTHYFDYISEELGFITQNYGVGGSGYAKRQDEDKAFYQRILEITEPFDVMTIFGSVNDLSSGLPLGTYEDNDTTTIGGCINQAIDNFYSVAPFKVLGIISQPPSVGTANNGHLLGTNAQAYNDLLKQICTNRGIPFLDIFNCSGLKPWDSDFREEFYNEDGAQDTGVHPNSKGQKMLSTKIREFMKTLI